MFSRLVITFSLLTLLVSCVLVWYFPQSLERSLNSLDWGFVFHSQGSIVIDDNPHNNDVVSNEILEVWWYAPFFSGGGYSSEAIDFAVLLSESQVNVRIVQHGDSYEKDFIEGLDDESLFAKLKKLFVFPENAEKIPHNNHIVVCHSETGAWNPPLYQTSICPTEDSLYKIGRTMFETDRLPKGWSERCNKMDEIWVPTDFHRKIFVENGVIESKIYVIPEGVDTRIFDPSKTEPLELPIKENKFKFLSVFKWEKRKGYDLLLAAYLESFTKQDEVSLLLLTHGYHGEVLVNEAVKNISLKLGLQEENLPEIVTFTKFLKSSEMPRLYKSIDCLVLPSRGEGWGRPHTEAMAMGKPVIATNWSGNTHFMNDKNSFLIAIDGLEEIEEGPFKSHLWASPSLAHLKQLMKFLVQNPNEAISKGNQARQDITNHYNYDSLSRIVKHRLREITKNLESQRITKNENANEKGRNNEKQHEEDKKRKNGRKKVFSV